MLREVSLRKPGIPFLPWRRLELRNDVKTEDAPVPLSGLVPVRYEQLDVIDLQYAKHIHAGAAPYGRIVTFLMIGGVSGRLMSPSRPWW